MQVINWSLVDKIIPERHPEADKNSFGRTLLICGSEGYTGAAYFAAQAAVRTGGGVITLATPQNAWPILAVKLNEPVVRPLPCSEDGTLSKNAVDPVLMLSEKADAVLIGCGLGRSEGVVKVVLSLLRNAKCQTVLDADGINALSKHKDVLREAKLPPVLTPHRFEFFRLSGMKNPSPEEVSAFAVKYRCTVLYKAHRSIIATYDGRLLQNNSGNPGMAKGGSGDVLAGMLASLCGQGLNAVDAACAAAWLHGKAGDLAANELGEYGMTPGDMLDRLPLVLKRYNSREW